MGKEGLESRAVRRGLLAFPPKHPGIQQQPEPQLGSASQQATLPLSSSPCQLTPPPAFLSSVRPASVTKNLSFACPCVTAALIWCWEKCMESW